MNLQDAVPKLATSLRCDSRGNGGGDVHFALRDGSRSVQCERSMFISLKLQFPSSRIKILSIKLPLKAKNC
jgi:hypothetical protein